MVEAPTPPYVPPEVFYEVRGFVESEFSVQESYIEGGVPTFVIAPGPTKEPFKRLANKMKQRGYMPFLRMVDGRLIIRVIPKPVFKPSKIQTNVILFFATLGTVLFSAYYILSPPNPILTQELMPGVNIFVLMIFFTASIFAIIGLHELAHFATCKRNNVEATLPYFIPGVPPFGTFGAIIMQKEPPTNRDELFDLGSSGPLIGFISALVLTIICVRFFVFVVPNKVIEDWMQKYPGAIGPLPWFPPLLLQFLMSIINPASEGYTPILTPIALIIPWVGLTLTFLNLMPAWQFDGGWVALALFGPRWHRIISWISLTVMFLLGFWPMAVLALFGMLSGRQVGPLDNVSPVSSSRKALLGVLLVILVLCTSYLPYF